MQTILLASGYNKRVQHLFPNLPKIMFPLGRVPYLKYWLDILLPQKTDIIILVQYLSNVVKKYVQENYAKEVKFGKIKIIDRSENLGPVKTVAQMKDIIKDRFSILYCDILFQIDLDAAQKALDNFTGLVFLTADEFNMFNKMEILIDEKNKIVTKFQPNGFDHASGWMDVGQIYEKETLNIFNNTPDAAEHFNLSSWPELIKEKNLTYWKVGPVFDIGTEKNYIATNNIFKLKGISALSE